MINLIVGFPIWRCPSIWMLRCGNIVLLIVRFVDMTMSPAGWVPPLSHLTSCTPTKCNLYFESSSELPMVSYLDFIQVAGKVQ
jgi:hypothetical protein